MNPIYVFDFTIAENQTERTELTEWLSLHAKKWCFQLEKGEETDYIHYQGRFSLKSKKRLGDLLTLSIPTMHISPTSNANKKNNFYVMKSETRIDGPWTEEDEVKYIPRQYRGKLKTLRPFQKYIWDSANDFEDRKINMIFCSKGNVGKTVIASLCELYGNGIDLPPVNDAEKLIQSCCNICMGKKIRNPSPIFIDLPRAFCKDRLNGIYSAIEQIKKGKLVDMRYHYKDWWIDSPQIWVFSNIEPDLSMLSLDRWMIWEIDEHYELKPFGSNTSNGKYVPDDGITDSFEDL